MVFAGTLDLGTLRSIILLLSVATFQECGAQQLTVFENLVGTVTEVSLLETHNGTQFGWPYTESRWYGDKYILPGTNAWRNITTMRFGITTQANGLGPYNLTFSLIFMPIGGNGLPGNPIRRLGATGTFANGSSGIATWGFQETPVTVNQAGYLALYVSRATSANPGSVSLHYTTDNPELGTSENWSICNPISFSNPAFTSSWQQVPVQNLRVALYAMRVAGRLSLLDYRHDQLFDSGYAGQTVSVQVEQAGTVVENLIAPLGPNGEFAVSPVTNGSVLLKAKFRTGLRKAVAWTLGSASSSGLTYALTNGDIDNDNEIGPGDFGALSAAFGSVIGDSNWVEYADLDRDGEVGPSDFGILSANFGLSGD